MTGERRRYNALANVPWQVRSDIAKKIKQMPDGNEKTILTLYFIDGISSTDIPEYCERHGIRSRSGTFFTPRSIQNIVSKHFPEVKLHRKPNPQKEIRREHFVFTRNHKAERCEICGSTDRLEWHHKNPLSDGGGTTEENMMQLCQNCHRMYHRIAVTITKG